MTSNFSHTIWSERRIDISELETTDIPNTIRCLKWGNFILPPPQYHPEIVRDFYAALVPETFEESGIVFVRGRKVVITAKLINEYFCTPDVPETNFMGGRTREEFFSLLGSKFVVNLKWDKSNQILGLRYEELHPEMALWTMFINHNLIPSTNQTFISPEISQTLFCIKSGIPIDVGYLIHDQICYANDSGSSLLPFPSLITHFCRVSGVTIPADLSPPLADLGRVSYNSFAHQQGLPTLPSKKRDRVSTMPVQPQGRVPTMAVQPPGRVPTVPVQPQGPVQLQYGNTDRPKWVNEISGRLNSLSDMIVSQYNGLSTQMNNLGMRVTSLENAMRDEHLDSHRRVRARLNE